MRIQCPFCGERDSSEFVYLGDANCRRPDSADRPASQAELVEAVYLRDNSAGPHDEIWYHRAACRSCLRVKRDTRTHKILAVAFANGCGGT